MFLMYRVELKVCSCLFKDENGIRVPNVPCGVERHPRGGRNEPFYEVFLMYRVELKVSCKFAKKNG